MKGEQGGVPSGYFRSYDSDGEPRTILSSGGDPLGGSTSEYLMRAEREVSACIDADHLYETMRLQEFSHEEAREVVKEKFNL